MILLVLLDFKQFYCPYPGLKRSFYVSVVEVNEFSYRQTELTAFNVEWIPRAVAAILPYCQYQQATSRRCYIRRFRRFAVTVVVQCQHQSGVSRAIYQSTSRTANHSNRIYYIEQLLSLLSSSVESHTTAYDSQPEVVSKRRYYTSDYLDLSHLDYHLITKSAKSGSW